MFLASYLIIVKLVSHVVPYSRTESGLLQIVPKFAVSDTGSLLVLYTTYSSYPLHAKSGFRVWVWEGLPGGINTGLYLER